MKTSLSPSRWFIHSPVIPLLVFLITAHGRAQDCTPLVITYNPPSQTALENCPVTFAVTVTGTGPYSYQWFRDGQAVTGATNSTYTIPHVTLADNSARVRATVANACSQTTSAEAVLSVLADVVPPRLLRARGDASLERVIVTFEVGVCGGPPGLDIMSAQDPWNYTLSGGLIVSNAQLEANGTNVILTTSRQLSYHYYTLRVAGVTDSGGNQIPPGGEAAFQSWVVDPNDPTKVVPPPVTLTRSGSDIWITWPYGSFLQKATNVAGSWQTLVNVDFPYPVPPDGSTQFYRALFDP